MGMSRFRILLISLRNGGEPLNNKSRPYHVINLTPGRRVMINMLNLEGSKHSMYGLLEVDVTAVRQFMAEHKAHTGETLSFTGFITFCLAHAVAQDTAVQAYLKGRKQMVLFDEVDVGLMVERKIGDKKALMGHIVRGADHKTYWEIHQEIRSVQSTPVPPNRGLPTWFRRLMLLPWPLSGWFNALLRMIMRNDPTIAVSLGGTVGVTAIGMFGEGHNGWGIFPLTHVLGLVVGSIAWKPAVVDGRIEPREILNLTIVFDHEVIDGAPATRFARQLIEMIESGYGLIEDQNVAAEAESAKSF